jgi:hypothetical protein
LDQPPADFDAAPAVSFKIPHGVLRMGTGDAKRVEDGEVPWHDLSNTVIAEPFPSAEIARLTTPTGEDAEILGKPRDDCNRLVDLYCVTRVETRGAYVVVSHGTRTTEGQATKDHVLVELRFSPETFVRFLEACNKVGEFMGQNGDFFFDD